MPRAPCLCLLAAVLSLGLCPATGGMDSCYDAQGRARRCMPVFENAAFGREVQVTNTCGSPPEDYCLQMDDGRSTQLCRRCDMGDPLHHHNATYLTDFHSQEESTWWQSQSMAFGVQHPNSVNITLRLGKCSQNPPILPVPRDLPSPASNKGLQEPLESPAGCPLPLQQSGLGMGCWKETVLGRKRAAGGSSLK